MPSYKYGFLSVNNNNNDYCYNNPQYRIITVIKKDFTCIILAFSRCLTCDILISLNPKCGIYASNCQYKPHILQARSPSHSILTSTSKSSEEIFESNPPVAVLSKTSQWSETLVLEVRKPTETTSKSFNTSGSEFLKFYNESNQNTKRLQTRLLLSYQLKKIEFYCLLAFSN